MTKKSKRNFIFSKIKKQTKKKTDKQNLILESSNHHILDILSTVKSYYEKLNNSIHVNAYERAIYQLSKVPFPITSGKQVSNLPGIGKGMVEKIDTILKTGSLDIITQKNLPIIKWQSKKMNGTMDNKITSILGFGPANAKEIEKKYKITTANELLNLYKTKSSDLDKNLTHIQKIGIQYHKDLKTPISRTETETIFNSYFIPRIEKFINQYKLYCMIAGSYPSGKKESKDIDILISSPDKYSSKHKQILNQIINEFKENSEIITLSKGESKFLGLIKGNETGIWHHLDMRIVSHTEFPFARLYYASGKVFNKMIRERLKKKGYKLNEFGLFLAITGKNMKIGETEGEKESINLEEGIRDGVKLETYADKIEKKVFELANLDYKTIPERY